ncbi:MAG: hypothetical protein D6768_19620 [Chloroflexi bacterium]|nr:MAG: hypothetical protein D6768_19620 [Chloroflexota bacterium]
MPEADNQAILIHFIEQIWNQGNFDDVESVVAPRYTIHRDPGDPWEGQTLDRETFKKRVLYSRTAFPDLRFIIEEVVAAAGKVAIGWYFTGTHRGDLPGVPASGQKINMPGLTIYYFNQGQISGHWQVIDRLGFLAQVGLLGNL